MNNPFIITGYQSADLFCDRKNEIELLKSAAIDSKHNTLFSIRRMGKTGLMQHLQSVLEAENIKVIYFDIMMTNSVNDFVEQFSRAFFKQAYSTTQKTLQKASEILKNIVPSMTADPITGEFKLSLTLSSQKDNYEDIENIIEYIKSSNSKFLIMIDEFQQITNYKSSGLEQFLRSKIQFLNNCAFIFSGSKKHLLLSMFGEHTGPFWQFSAFMELKPINQDTYYTFVSEQFMKNNQRISLEAFDYIYIKMQGITYFVQSVCHELYNSNIKNINQNNVVDTITELVAQKENYYVNLWHLLTQKQKDMLSAISLNNGIDKPLSNSFLTEYKLGAASTISSVLEALIDKELVYYENKLYRLTDPLMEEWLRNV